MTTGPGVRHSIRDSIRQAQPWQSAAEWVAPRRCRKVGLPRPWLELGERPRSLNPEPSAESILPLVVTFIVSHGIEYFQPVLTCDVNLYCPSHTSPPLSYEYSVRGSIHSLV